MSGKPGRSKKDKNTPFERPKSPAIRVAATFGVIPGEHKVVKKLEKENLRDHMTTLELVFTMLGEASTAEIARRDEAQGFEENLASLVPYIWYNFPHGKTEKSPTRLRLSLERGH